MPPRTPARHPEAALYRRNASRLTGREVLHSLDKDALVAQASPLRRRKVRAELEQQWAVEEQQARREAEELVAILRESVRDLEEGLEQLAALRAPELLGKVEAELLRVRSARAELDHAED